MTDLTGVTEVSVKPAPEFCDGCREVTASAESGGAWACGTCNRPRLLTAPAALRMAGRGIARRIVPAGTEVPAEFAGRIRIEWPENTHAGPLQGWAVSVRDEAGSPIVAVTSVTVHAVLLSIIWAEVTMHATEDGQPVMHLPKAMTAAEFEAGYFEDGEPRTGTFPFQVISMRVAGESREGAA